MLLLTSMQIAFAPLLTQFFHIIVQKQIAVDVNDDLDENVEYHSNIQFLAYDRTPKKVTI